MNDSRFKCIREKISVHVYVLESSLQYYILFSLFCLSFGLLALFDLHLHTFFAGLSACLVCSSILFRFGSQSAFFSRKSYILTK